jgi:hypothetical protein
MDQEFMEESFPQTTFAAIRGAMCLGQHLSTTGWKKHPALFFAAKH